MNVKTKNGQVKKSIAINEVSILRQGKQASSISITSNKKNIIKNWFWTVPLLMVMDLTV